MNTRYTIVPGALLLALVGCAPPAAAPEESPSDALVDVGTHRLHLHRAGTGSPTIVIETGVGETYESCLPIIEALARDARVCAYERAGYGRSEAGPLPRDAGTEADELRRLLANAGETGPFLLVGQSLGGLNAQVFAARYPEDVFGLVLLDPSPRGWVTGDGFPELRTLFDDVTTSIREAAATARASTDPEQRGRAPYLEAVASEHEQLFHGTARALAAIESFGAMPLTVIAATEANPQFGPTAESFRQFWNDESRALAAMSERGRFILAEGSTHHVHRDAPQVVLDAVRSMIEENSSR